MRDRPNRSRRYTGRRKAGSYRKARRPQLVIAIGRVALDPRLWCIAGLRVAGAVPASVWQVGGDLPYGPRGIGDRLREAPSACRSNL